MDKKNYIKAKRVEQVKQEEDIGHIKSNGSS